MTTFRYGVSISSAKYAEPFVRSYVETIDDAHFAAKQWAGLDGSPHLRDPDVQEKHWVRIWHASGENEGADVAWFQIRDLVS